MASEENTAREAETKQREAPAEERGSQAALGSSGAVKAEPPRSALPAFTEAAMLYCPVCDQRLQQLKCKLICERCGYFMSCADYY